MANEAPATRAALNPLDRAERRAAAVAKARAKRHENRELLLKREHANDPPPNPRREVTKLLFGAVLFLPILVVGYAIEQGIEWRFGGIAASIFAVAASLLLAAIIYNGPSLIGRAAKDVAGLVKDRKRNPVAFWGAIVLILVISLFLFGATQRNSAIGR